MAKVRKSGRTDRNIVLGLAAGVLLAVLAFSLFGPSRDATDPRPTTYNNGSQGVRATYVVLGELGYDARRWESPLEKLRGVDAANATLVLTNPILPVKSLKQTQAGVADFLYRGGRVLATGASGAALLPNGETAAPGHLYEALCYTVPEGAGALAKAGKVAIGVPVRWSANGPEFRVEERCGGDAVVVRYPYGKGEAIWWSSPMPLTNAGLKDDASLTLALVSLGPAKHGETRRIILFDEYLHEDRESMTDLLAGLPWWPLGGQAAALGVLLVFSRGRRNGPLRGRLSVPRSSPLEFAESMGRLYQRVKATQAPLDAARAQTLRFLAEECGLAQDVLRQTPDALAGALAGRIGGDWSRLAEHLDAASGAGIATSKQALAVVKALEQDRREIALQVSSARQTVVQ